MEIWSELVVAVPTFRRNHDLAELLASVSRQHTRPGLVLVLDNSPEGLAREIVENSPVAAEYVALGRNTGPAGSFAEAIERCADRFDWLMCRGDDNPFGTGAEIATTRAFARKVEHLRPAGIGYTGVRFVPSLGRSVWHSTEELRPADWLEVDGLTGGGCPTYHLPTVTSVGANFDRDLFFGFEELDFGMRLRREGCRLLLDTQEALAYREALGWMHIGPTSKIPGVRESSWRSYFTHRNRVIVANRYAGRLGAARLGARSIAKAAFEIVRGSPERSVATLIGLWDGLRASLPRATFIPP